MNNSSEDKLEKITDLMWKIWWFFLYLIIISSIIFVIFYFVLFNLGLGTNASIAYSIPPFVTTQLLLYTKYDQYRNKQIFNNQKNNLNARLFLIFGIPLVSLVIPLIFLLLIPEDPFLKFLPALYYGTINLNIFYFSYKKPIEMFRPDEKKFYGINVMIWIKEPHNLVLLGNWFIHLIVLLFSTQYLITSLSAILALNSIFWLYLWFYTDSERASFSPNEKTEKYFGKRLTIFKNKFVISIESLIVGIMILIPAQNLIFQIPFSSLEIFSIVSNILLILCFCLLYTKLRLVSSLYFWKLREVNNKSRTAYTNYNFIITLLLFLGIVGTLYFMELIVVSIFFFPLFFYDLYLEGKSDYISNHLLKYFYFTLVITPIFILSFFILPFYFPILSFQFQLAIFTISLYFTLEIFKRRESFKEENILIIQNIIAIIAFFSITYSIYPLIITQELLFTSIIEILFISRIFIFLIIFLFTLLISFYRLYSVYFREQKQKIFKKALFLNFGLLDLLIFTYLNYRIFLLFTVDIFLPILCFSIVLFFVLFIIFIYINSIFNIIKKPSIYYFYLNWGLISSLFMFITSLTIPWILSQDIILLISSISIILLDIIILFSFIQLQLKYGYNLEKFSEDLYSNASNIDLVLISLSFFSLSLIVSNFFIFQNLFLSIFISLVLSTIIVNIGVSINEIKNETFKILLNFTVLFYFALILFYGFFLLSLNTFYIFNVPLLFFCIGFNFALIYLLQKNYHQKLIIKLMWINNVILSGLIIAFPGLFNAEVVMAGQNFDIMNTINYSLYIFYGILVFFYLALKKKDLDENISNNILKVQVLIECIIAGTTVFYYSNNLLSGFFIGLIVPLILTSTFLFLPLGFSYSKSLFSRDIIKYLILINTLFLSVFIISIPTFIGLELVKVGYFVHVYYIILPTLVLLFVFIKFIDIFGQESKVSSEIIALSKLIQILDSLAINIVSTLIILELFSGFLMPYNFFMNLLLMAIPILIFLLSNIITLWLIKDILNYEYISQKDKMKTILGRIYDNFQQINVNGIFLILSSILSSIILISNLLTSFYQFQEIIKYFILFALFFTLLLPLQLKFHKRKENYQIGWLSNYSQTIVFLLNVGLLSYLYIENFWTLFFLEKLPLDLSSAIGLSLLSFFVIEFLIKSKIRIIEGNSFLKTYYLTFFKLNIVLFSIFLNTAEFLLFSILILYLVLLYERPEDHLRKFEIYLLLSVIGFTKTYIFFDLLDVLGLVLSLPFGFQIILYLIHLIIIFALSIAIYSEVENLIERYSIYSLLSTVTFLSLISFADIFLIYQITISILVLFFLLGFDFYLRENEKYKWFIRPGILLLVFNLSSWISYTLLFINPGYQFYNIILTFSLTTAITSICFVILFNELPYSLRKITFLIALSSFIIFSPGFLYALLISYFGFSYSNPILIIIMLNLTVVLFYISIGIYQWEISWIIWKIGWWLWLFVPLINFYLIYNLFGGIDILTSALSFFGILDINGSLIITLVICSLFYLPVLYLKLKQYFNIVLLVIWSESLALTYWISQNLFIENVILSSLFFGILSLFLLMPILWRLKFWKLFSLIWFLLASINVGFVNYLFCTLAFGIDWIIGLTLIAAGIFLMIYSLFPNVRSYGIILIISYFIIFVGLFLVIFSILFIIIINPFISLNLTFMMIAGGLFSSKYLKINQPIMKFVISLILVINSSLLVYFSFSLITNYHIFAIFFACSIFFGSLLLFNNFGYLVRKIKVRIFWLPLGVSVSLAATFLLAIYIPERIWILMSVFTIINILFIHRILYRYKFVLFFLYPISLAFISLSVFNYLLLIREVLLLVWAVIYIITFQLLINLGKRYIKPQEKEYGLYNYLSNLKLFKEINLICFISNSIFLSLIFAYIFSPIFLYRIFLFILFLSILNILVIYYFRINSEVIGVKSPERYTTSFGLIFYSTLIISLAFFIGILLLNIQLLYNIIYLSHLIVFLFLFELLIDFYSIKLLELKLKVRFGFCLLSLLSYLTPSLILFLLVDFSALSLPLAIGIFVTFFAILNLITLKVAETILGFGKSRIINFLELFFDLLSLISVCSLISLSISDFTLFLLIELQTNPIYYIIMILLYFSITGFVLSSIIVNKIKSTYKTAKDLFLTGIIIFLPANLMIIFILYNLINLFLINLVLLLELFLLYISINNANIFALRDKFSTPTKKLLNYLSYAIYIQILVVSYFFISNFLGIQESLLVVNLILISSFILDITVFNELDENVSRALLAPSVISLSVFGSIVLLKYLYLSFILLKLTMVFFISMLLLANYLFYGYRQKAWEYKEDSESYFNSKKFVQLYERINIVLVILWYLSILYLIQESLFLLDLFSQLLILSVILFAFTYIDEFVFQFLKHLRNYLRLIAWIIIMVDSNILLFNLFFLYLYNLSIISIPFVILLIDLELFGFLFLSKFLSFIRKNEFNIKRILFGILYFDFVTFPIYFFSSNLILNYNLLLLSLIIFLGILRFLNNISYFMGENLRKKLSYYCSFIFIHLLSLDLFILLEVYMKPLYAFVTLFLSLNLSLLVLFAFYIVILDLFQRSSKITFISWIVLFLLISAFLFQITYQLTYYSLAISLSLFIISILVFPFVFLLEILKDFFNNLINKIAQFIHSLKLHIKLLLEKVKVFIKQNWVILWKLTSVFIGGMVFILTFFYLGLNLVSSLLVGFGIVVFLIYFVIAQIFKNLNPNLLLKYRIIYLSSIWAGTLGIIFNYIGMGFYLLALFLSLTILGAIFLPYIYYLEKKEGISIKWRFYLTLFFIIILIITLLIFYLQFLINLI
ncbi:MAG: membrane protein of unknown function [Promethearchaeota archaeon]|nr:MAG: membrane protein of unknown function [Candidatus Lokiarchaeota archaeon]